jgi:hypothetical protein
LWRSRKRSVETNLDAADKNVRTTSAVHAHSSTSGVTAFVADAKLPGTSSVYGRKQPVLVRPRLGGLLLGRHQIGFQGIERIERCL